MSDSGVGDGEIPLPVFALQDVQDRLSCNSPASSLGTLFGSQRLSGAGRMHIRKKPARGWLLKKLECAVLDRLTLDAGEFPQYFDAAVRGDGLPL